MTGWCPTCGQVVPGRPGSPLVFAPFEPDNRLHFDAGFIINRVYGMAPDHTGVIVYPIDPPFVVTESGFYRAIIDTESGTARIEACDPWPGGG